MSDKTTSRVFIAEKSNALIITPFYGFFLFEEQKRFSKVYDASFIKNYMNLKIIVGVLEA